MRGGRQHGLCRGGRAPAGKGRSGLPGHPLYRVRFRQADVWPDYGGPAGDTVDVEIYQHWLEAEEHAR